MIVTNEECIWFFRLSEKRFCSREQTIKENEYSEPTDFPFNFKQFVYVRH